MLKETTMAIHDADNIITARKGAVHEKLTDWLAQLQAELLAGSISLKKLSEMDPSQLASNLLDRVTRSGDGRISDQSLTK